MIGGVQDVESVLLEVSACLKAVSSPHCPDVTTRSAQLVKCPEMTFID